MMRLPPHAPGAVMGGALAQSLEGFRYVWHHIRVRTIFALFAIVGIFGWSYSVLMPPLRATCCISANKATAYC